METDNKKPRNCTMVIIWVIMGIIVAAVVCCVVGFFCPVFKYADENNLVITFLGALAAFVVISNYAQMVEIKNDTKRKLDDIQEKEKKINKFIAYYDNQIKKDVLSVLKKKYSVNNALPIYDVDIKNVEALRFLVRIKVHERNEKGERNMFKYEYWYYKVNLLNQTASDSSKEEFDEFKE